MGGNSPIPFAPVGGGGAIIYVLKSFAQTLVEYFHIRTHIHSAIPHGVHRKGEGGG